MQKVNSLSVSFLCDILNICGTLSLLTTAAVTTKLKQVHEAELKRIRKDSEVALAKLKAELSSVAGERDTFKRKVAATIA